jgi:hypothetical protein
MAALFPAPFSVYFDDNGNPLAGGLVYTYVAGTTTPLATYTDSGGGTPNANPVVLDSAGRANIWYDGSKLYKIVLKSSAGATIRTSDNVGMSADGIRFIQAGTGAIAETVQTGLRRVVFLDQFCVCDGTTDDTTGWANAVAAATGGTLFLPNNKNSRITAKVTLPRSIKILGPTRRGVGNPPSTIGFGLLVDFAGPAFEYAPGSLTSCDILLEGFTIRGVKGTYGAGDGIVINNAADAELNHIVVSNFGTNNISLNGNTHTINAVYSADAGNANYYIDSEKTKILNCQSDGGVYAVYGTANSADLSIDDAGFFEGATNTGIYAGGQRTTIDNSTVNMTAGGKGIVNGASAPRLHLGTGVRVLGEGTAASTIGIDLGANIEYSLMGVISTGFVTACKFTDGFGNIIGGQLEGTATGLDATSGSFWAVVQGVMISGPTNSLLHNSGNKVKYLGNRYDNGSGSYKAPTVTSGTPEADFEVPFTAGFAFGGGTTGITYAGRAASYTKIGGQVHVQGQVSLSAKGSSTGGLTLTGLPFAATGTASNQSTPAVKFSDLTGISGAIGGYLNPSGTTVAFEYLGTGTAGSVDDTKCTNSTALAFSMTYTAAE